MYCYIDLAVYANFARFKDLVLNVVQLDLFLVFSPGFWHRKYINSILMLIKNICHISKIPDNEQL